MLYSIIQSRPGFIAVRTSTLIIFGSYSSSMYPAVFVEAVEKLGKGNFMGNGMGGVTKLIIIATIGNKPNQAF